MLCVLGRSQSEQNKDFLPPTNWIKWKVIGRIFQEWQILLTQNFVMASNCVGFQSSSLEFPRPREHWEGNYWPVCLGTWRMLSIMQILTNKWTGEEGVRIDPRGGVSASVMGSCCGRRRPRFPYSFCATVEDVRATQPSSCHRGYLLIVAPVFVSAPSSGPPIHQPII